MTDDGVVRGPWGPREAPASEREAREQEQRDQLSEPTAEAPREMVGLAFDERGGVQMSGARSLPPAPEQAASRAIRYDSGARKQLRLAAYVLSRGGLPSRLVARWLDRHARRRRPFV